MHTSVTNTHRATLHAGQAHARTFRVLVNARITHLLIKRSVSRWPALHGRERTCPTKNLGQAVIVVLLDTGQIRHVAIHDQVTGCEIRAKGGKRAGRHARLVIVPTTQLAENGHGAVLAAAAFRRWTSHRAHPP